MATSGSTDWTRTRDQIIKGALRNIGAYASGETPSSSDISDGSEALNMMVKAWQAEGGKLWLNDTTTLSLVADQQSYTIGSGGDLDIVRPLGVDNVRYHYNTGSIEVPMTSLSREEYFDLPDKAATGIPLQYYYDPQLSLGVFYIWPVVGSSTSDTIKMTFKTEVEDFDSASNNADFPVEWLRALKFNLAIELAPEHGKEVGPTLLRNADLAKREAVNWDREKNASIFLGVERR